MCDLVLLHCYFFVRLADERQKKILHVTAFSEQLRLKQWNSLIRNRINVLFCWIFCICFFQNRTRYSDWMKATPQILQLIQFFLFFSLQGQFISIPYWVSALNCICVAFFLSQLVFIEYKRPIWRVLLSHSFDSCWCLIKAQSIKLEDKQGIWIRSNVKCMCFRPDAIVIAIVSPLSTSHE